MLGLNETLQINVIFMVLILQGNISIAIYYMKGVSLIAKELSIIQLPLICL